jgi:carboxymethylenebutenolidase
MLKEEWISFGKDGACSGFLARLESAEPQPALLLIQEVWGVDRHIQDLAGRFARAGYVTLAPDLYAQGGRRPEALAPERIEAFKAFMDGLPPQTWGDPGAWEEALNPLPTERAAKLRETRATAFGGIQTSQAAHLEVLKQGLQYLGSDCPHSRGRKVASLGFCMGGSLSGQLSCQTRDLAGAVIFYGMPVSADQAAATACPVLGFYGETDTRIGQALPAYTEAMAKTGKSFESHVYAGAGHAFFNDTRRSFHPTAQRNAFARCLSFLAEKLA